MNKNTGVIKRDRELKISDLFWKVLYGWRLVVVLAVIFAIIVGGYGILQKWTNNKKNITSNEAQVTSVESLVASLTEEEILQINQVKMLDQYIKERQVYMDNSILMNIEPYNKHVLNIIYYLDTDNNGGDKVASVDTTDILYEAYKTYIVNGGYIDYVVEYTDWNLDEKYLLELITIDEDSNKTGILTIRVTGMDSEQIGIIADGLKNAINSYKDIIIKSIDNHSIIIMDEYETIVSDSSLDSGQCNMYFNLRDLKSERQALLNKFTDIQTQVYDFNNQEVIEQINIDNANDDKNTVNLIDLKYFILGMILGIGFACAWIICKYIFGSKIQSSYDLEEIYGLTNFGIISDYDSNNKILMCIDNLFDKVRGIKKLTFEQQCALCVADLKIKCKKNDIKKLAFIVSNKITNEQNKTFDFISSKLNSSGVKCILLDDMINNLERYEELSSMSYAILMGNLGKTTYCEIETELKICNKFDVNIFGYILLM